MRIQFFQGRRRSLCGQALLSIARSVAGTVFILAATIACFGWDYEGHRLVNQIALASLPTNFPAFVRQPETQERIAFLGGEPDRWRNTPDLPLKHVNSPDHYMDLEDLIPHRMAATNLSHFRYDFLAQVSVSRATNQAQLPPIDPFKDLDRTKALVGFLPWTITEHYAKLKSDFSCLRAFEEGGTPEEIANAQQNIAYLMGIMGHFVGDASQPLHTTKHYNGWVGENPHGYTTNLTFHSWIDGGYLRKVGVQFADLRPHVRPAKMLWRGHPKAKHDGVFPEVMEFILEQHQLVEPLYQLEKEGKLSGDDAKGQEGRLLIADQILKAGQMLGNLWYSAWQQAPPDTFLKAALAKRKLAQETAPPKP